MPDRQNEIVDLLTEIRDELKRGAAEKANSRTINANVETAVLPICQPSVLLAQQACLSQR